MVLYTCIKRTNIRKHACHNSCLKCKKLCKIYVDKTTEMFNEESPLNFKAKQNYQFSK
jgi:polyferredoxin